mmetsp:Transcript_53712/g.117700  ORF Transcript_53712/g.117700 Transcript_53712/m.117700 type:complete len:90 (-) Transcript_53712:28-297(-)
MKNHLSCRAIQTASLLATHTFDNYTPPQPPRLTLNLHISDIRPALAHALFLIVESHNRAVAFRQFCYNGGHAPELGGHTVPRNKPDHIT